MQVTQVKVSNQQKNLSLSTLLKEVKVRKNNGQQKIRSSSIANNFLHSNKERKIENIDSTLIDDFQYQKSSISQQSLLRPESENSRNQKNLINKQYQMIQNSASLNYNECLPHLLPQMPLTIKKFKSSSVIDASHDKHLKERIDSIINMNNQNINISKNQTQIEEHSQNHQKNQLIWRRKSQKVNFLIQNSNSNSLIQYQQKQYQNQQRFQDQFQQQMTQYNQFFNPLQLFNLPFSLFNKPLQGLNKMEQIEQNKYSSFSQSMEICKNLQNLINSREKLSNQNQLIQNKKLLLSPQQNEQNYINTKCLNHKNKISFIQTINQWKPNCSQIKFQKSQQVSIQQQQYHQKIKKNLKKRQSQNSISTQPIKKLSHLYSTNQLINERYIPISQFEQIFQQKDLMKNTKLKLEDNELLRLPMTKAQSWTIFDISNQRQLINIKNNLQYNHNELTMLSKKGKKIREIASLTKIMTCFLILQFVNDCKIKVDLNQDYAKVSKKAARTIGTSAQLKTGDKLKIHDLLYGLMLPSGNDAAQCLAEYFGKKLLQKDQEQKLEIKQSQANSKSSLNQIQKQQELPEEDKILNEEKRKKSIQKSSSEQEINNNIEEIRGDIEEISVKKSKKSTYQQRFVLEMNIQATQLGLTQTIFSNPHGLSNPKNTSTSNDIAVLAAIAMQNKLFRQIVNSKQYQCIIEYSQKIECNQNNDVSEEQNIIKYREMVWKNTNKLLEMGFQGVKTGQTDKAGPCLCSYYEDQNAKYIFVVLSTDTKDQRFTESIKLLNFITMARGHELQLKFDTLFAYVQQQKYKKKKQNEQIEQQQRQNTESIVQQSQNQ